MQYRLSEVHYVTRHKAQHVRHRHSNRYNCYITINPLPPLARLSTTSLWNLLAISASKRLLVLGCLGSGTDGASPRTVLKASLEFLGTCVFFMRGFLERGHPYLERIVTVVYSRIFASQDLRLPGLVHSSL